MTAETPSQASFGAWLLVFGLLFSEAAAAQDHKPDRVPEARKQIIGATALVTETLSGFEFKARVDTGAASCSIHVEEFVIDGEAEDRKENIGKPIRFRLKSATGQEEWLEAKIAQTILVKTSENYERRYKVLLKLRRGSFEKEVLVSLNDRSHLQYPLLLGRNYLRGDFLVDVELDTDELEEVERDEVPEPETEETPAEKSEEKEE